MNAERLHVIVKALKKEIDQRNLLSIMQNLVNGLRAVVQQSNASTQQNLSSYLSSVYQALAGSEVDGFSPTWKQILKEIGGEDLFGAALKDKIEDILARNQITLAVGADELEKTRTRMEQFYNALNQIIAAFGALRIGDETLAPGECEIGMLIPRHAVDNRLIDFTNELKELGFILNTFSEVATGQQDDLPIKTISTSDFLVFVGAHAPQFAACVALAVERVVALYKNLLEIRKLQVEIHNQGVPDTLTKGIEDHANQLMDTGIEKVSAEIIQQFYTGKDGGRKNELAVAVRISLNKIANRIDHGYNVEVRCAPLAAPDEAEEEVKQAIATIQNASQNMQFLKLEGKPLLKLPERAAEQTAKPKKRTHGGRKESSHQTEGGGEKR